MDQPSAISHQRSAVIVYDPEPPVELTWFLAPEEQQAFDIWMDCRDKWLNSLQRKSRGWTNTRRAYESDWKCFFASYRNIQLLPWQVGSLHVEEWIAKLYAAELCDATVNRRLAALSSFYNYASYNYTLMTPNGEKALWEHPNPFRRPQRVRVDPYQRSVYPSTEQVAALLNQIPLTEVQGWRDMALILGMFVSTRRVSEWTRLRWRDIHESDDGSRWFEYRYKGGKVKRQAISPALWAVIERYLHNSGRLATMLPDDWLFIASSDPFHRRRPGDPDAPISAHRVNDLLKKYGRRAGIPDDRLHAHALRHAGARLRHAQGADILEIRDILGHANIQITQVYVETVLESPEDSRGEAVLAAIMPAQLKFAFSGENPQPATRNSQSDNVSYQPPTSPRNRGARGGRP